MTFPKPLAEQINRFGNDIHFFGVRPAQVCTSAGNTDTGSPLHTDGRIWVLPEGNHAPILAYNSAVADNGVGHWCWIATDRGSGETEVWRPYTARNYTKGGRNYAAWAASGPQQSPDTMRPKHKYDASRNPNANDDSSQGFSTISQWVNNSTDVGYYNVDATVASAIWRVLLMISSFVQGDLFYGSAANTLAALAKNTTATRYLSNTGASNNPAWAQVNLANGVTGTLPKTNGGSYIQPLSVNVTEVGNVGGGADTLMSYTMPNDTMGTNLDSLEIECAIQFAASANSKQVEFLLGSTVLFDSTALAITTATDGVLRGSIIREGASAQKYNFTLNLWDGTTATTEVSRGNAAEDLSTSLDLKMRGTVTGVPTDNEIIQESMRINLVKAP